MQKFELHLKNENLKTYRVLNWLFLIANVFVLLFSMFQANSKSSIVVLISIIVYFIAVFIYKKKQKQFEGVFLIMTAIIWINLRLGWFTILTLFLILLSVIVSRKLKTVFLIEKIIYPSFPKKNILWETVSNVILKDGILTIDLKNNKIFQNEIIESTDKFSVDEIQFNQFCQEQLNKKSVS